MNIEKDLGFIEGKKRFERFEELDPELVNKIYSAWKRLFEYYALTADGEEDIQPEVEAWCDASTDMAIEILEELLLPPGKRIDRRALEEAEHKDLVRRVEERCVSEAAAFDNEPDSSLIEEVRKLYKTIKTSSPIDVSLLRRHGAIVNQLAKRGFQISPKGEEQAVEKNGKNSDAAGAPAVRNGLSDLTRRS